MSDKLLPCPFCGSQSEIYEYEHEGQKYFTVGCSECMITTQGSDNEQELITTWNKRTYEQNNVELKPCPFCGSKNVIRTTLLNGTKTAGYYVECSECGADSAIFNAQQDAFNAWNTRAKSLGGVNYD